MSSLRVAGESLPAGLEIALLNYIIFARHNPLVTGSGASDLHPKIDH